MKNKGWEIETSTNVQKFDQILQNHGKDGGKGGQDGQKSGLKIYKKSARGRKNRRDRVFKIEVVGKYARIRSVFVRLRNAHN